MSDRDDLETLVQGASRTDPYARLWTATVVLQHDDGTLDLDLDEATFRDLTRIPYVAGVGGGRLVIKPGQRLRLAFVGGTPDGAFTFGLEPDPSAEKGVVRVGDGGEGGTLSAQGVAPGSPVIFTYVGPDGALQSGTEVFIKTKNTQGSTEVFLR